MTRRSIRKLPTPQGIGAGQTATCQVPIGLTYHNFGIRMNVGGTPADVAKANWGSNIEEIRLNINGDSKIRINAEDLVALHDYYGTPVKDGVLPVNLSQHRMRTPQGEDFTAYGTQGLQSMTLEMDIASGVTINELSVYGVVSAGTPLGAHYTLRQYTVPQGVTGEREISELKRGRFGMLAFHLKSPNATPDIDTVEVEANNAKIHEYDRPIADAFYSMSERTLQTKWTHGDLAFTDRISHAQNMDLADFRVRADFNGTGNFLLFTENVEGAGA